MPRDGDEDTNDGEGDTHEQQERERHPRQDQADDYKAPQHENADPREDKDQEDRGTEKADKAMIRPPAPTAPLSGPVNSSALTMILVAPPSITSPHATMTSMINASTIAAFFAICDAFSDESTGPLLSCGCAKITH